MLELPSALASALDISEPLAALLISVGVLCSVAFALAMLKLDTIGVLAVLMAVIVLLVALTWMPYWVLILIVLMVAALFGKTIAAWLQGKGAGSG